MVGTALARLVYVVVLTCTCIVGGNADEAKHGGTSCLWRLQKLNFTANSLSDRRSRDGCRNQLYAFFTRKYV